MKKPNSVSDFSAARKEHLLKKYRESLGLQSKIPYSRINVRRAYRYAADSPAPRFWVSEERAAEVISKIMADSSILDNMYREKAEMYLEIYKRVMAIKKESPETPLGDIVFEVVNSPAPRFYLTWHSAKQLIKKSRV